MLLQTVLKPGKPTSRQTSTDLQSGLKDGMQAGMHRMYTPSSALAQCQLLWTALGWCAASHIRCPQQHLVRLQAARQPGDAQGGKGLLRCRSDGGPSSFLGL